MNTFTELNAKLAQLARNREIEDQEEVFLNIKAAIAEIVHALGVGYHQLGNPTLLNVKRVQEESARFVNAPGLARWPAAYNFEHSSGIPLDLKLFWLKKTTKSNLSWVAGLTPNFEDSPESLLNKNIGIDIVAPESGDRLFVVLSSRLKLRVLELHGRLSHTQREIFHAWANIATLPRDGGAKFKNELHEQLWKSFDYEPTNRQFYKVLVEHFDILVQHIEKQKISEDDAKMFAVRLTGRLLFLWFLRKKDLLNAEKGYFSVSNDDDQTSYYRSKLEPLFFEVLNVEVKKREFDDALTPFLNGGLFEPVRVDHYRDHKLTFPNGFFAGLYEKLDHYNFTVDEGTSEYEQVAIDPEMLGRVFESLLASLRTETGDQARKAQGAFYTPREIVDYMCSESLIEYLKTKLQDTENRDVRLRELVTMKESIFRDQDQNKRRDFEKGFGKEDAKRALDEIRVLDPAVGSGAFPMGMLHLLVKVYGRLDPKLEKNLAKVKREILLRSLYGVDIDQMAIQISRLRAWLSILVDTEKDDKIDPLPNLDFKFVCANTLLPLVSSEDTLFDRTSREELIEFRDQYYNATRKDEKEKIRKIYREKIRAAAGNMFASARERRLAEYDPFDPLTSASFYDPDLMHGVPEFDLVIGNPPYVQLQRNGGELGNLYEELGYDTFARTGDLYALFYERGLQLSKNVTGLECFITSNKWMRAGYGEKLRAYFLKHNPTLLIDLGSGVFESATVDTNIIIVKNSTNLFQLRAVTLKSDAPEELGAFVETHAVLLRKITQAPWAIGTDAEQKLKEKIERVGKPLKDWDVKIYRGVLTGLNEAFVITKDKRDQLIAEDPRSMEIIKPLLRGRDIKRYAYEESGLYILATGYDINIPDLYPAVYRHLKVIGDKIEKGEIKAKGKGLYLRDDKGLNWWNLRPCDYYDEFEGERIAWSDIATEPTFTMIPSGHYINNTLYMICGGDYALLGILNSKVIAWHLPLVATDIGENGTRYFKQFVELVSIPANNYKSEAVFEEIKSLSIQILNLKSQNSDCNTSQFEHEIDKLVYRLYELSPNEIELIEASQNK